MYSVTTKKLLSLLTAFAMVLSMVAIVQPIQTSAATMEIPISNGDFENGAFGGAVSTNGAATIVDNKNVHSGNYSVHLTKDGTNPNGTMTITVYPQATDADRTLTMKFWMMIPSGSTANSVHTQMLAWREWGSLLSEQYGAQYVAVDGNWYEKTVSVPVPANTGIVQVQLYADDTGTTPYIDDISMELDGTDLMTNGGLENGALNDGISYSSGSIELIHTPVHSGTYAAHADKATGGMITTTVSIEAAESARTMNLSYWLYVTPGAAANSAHNGVFCFDTVSNSPNWSMLTQKYGAQYAAHGQWTQMSLPIEVAAGADTLQIQIYAGDEGADFYIDDLCLTEEVADVAVNHDATLNLNQVTGDGTWQIGVASQTAIPAAYYKIPATIDGTACNILAQYNGDILIIYPNFFPALGGAVPTQQIIIEEGAVLTAADSNNGWTAVEGADTVTVSEKLDLSYVDGAWSKTVYTTDVTLSLNQVTGDGTWQFSISEAPANKYYKVPAIIDGVACTFLMGESGGMMCVYPNFFTALGGAVPTQQIIIEEGAVLVAADPNNGWNAVEGAETLTVSEKIDLSYVNGAWGKTVYTTNVTLGLNQVTNDGTWQFSISETPANKYYKVPAIIDGVDCTFLMGESGGIMCVYPNFFTALGGAVPTESIVIAEGTVLTAADPNNGWNAIEGANTLTVSEKIDLSYVDGAWGITVPNQDAYMEWSSVQADGTWQFFLDGTPANKYYKVPAIIDGVACSFLMGESDGLMCVYPDFFKIGGSIPAESLVIEAGAVMKPVDSTNGWAVIPGAETITITDTITVENVLDSWIDMSWYADVTFEEITADDLIVYKWEDQAESNYRSVYGIYAPDAQFGNDAGWGNFTKVAGKVLIDGVEVSAVYGMAPGADDESSWGANNAILLYITGEGYWDAVSTAGCVTICAGTTLISGVDSTKGVKFTEDFNMYQNCDTSWDTTEDIHVYNQQNTELEGALVTAATCQNAATYYYSCACGELGSETFTGTELGDHNYVNGTCSVCNATAQNITISLQTVTGDGTWQLIPSVAPANSYYKAPVIIDGKECNILIQYGSELLLIYPNFFTALGGAVPAKSFVIPAGTAIKAVDSANSWAEIEGAATLLVTEELKIENIAGKWIETSKYSNVEYKEIYAADLDLFYQNIMRLADYSDIEIAIAKQQYPEIADLIEIYGDDANMTTFGFYSVNPDLKIPNDANWSNFQLLGTISVSGAEAAETYVMQTPDSSEDAETAKDSGFLIRFYNGFVADVATSVTIEPGTRIVTKDGTAGFVFVDGYTIYRDADGNWSDVAPEGNNPVKKWGIALGDQIAVNFDMDIAQSDVVTATVGGVEKAVTKTENADGTYRITVAVDAACMADTIVLSINGTALENTYTLRGYADIILAGTYGENTKSLVKNMLNYGGAAQNYFGHNIENLANLGIQVDAQVPTGASAVQASGHISGLRFYGASLVHNATTAVRFYFTGNAEGATFKINGVDATVHTKSDMYYVELDGINPKDLANIINVEVTSGDQTISVEYSPLAYMVRMYATGSDATKALVQALYGYYLAAVAYAS